MSEMLATVKSDWLPPDDTRCECGTSMGLIAIVDGGNSEGIALYHECPNCPDDPTELDWPFVESEVPPSAFKALGFDVIYA